MLANILWLVVLLFLVSMPCGMIVRAEKEIMRVKQDHITLGLGIILNDLVGLLLNRILLLVLIATFYSWYGLPPRWVWWCNVIWCLFIGSCLVYSCRGKSIQSFFMGLLYIVMAAAIWYVFLHLSIFSI